MKMAKRKTKNCCACSICPACACCVCICTKDLRKILSPEAVKLLKQALA